MSREKQILTYLESVVYDKRPGFAAWFICCLLNSLSCIYAVSIKFYIFLFNSGIRKRHRLSKPVISIGNITVGGTGKTPVVQYIVRKLITLGANPAVLSYGYGGTLSGAYGVVSDAQHVILDASTAGDEPVMLAESLPRTPVIVCKHRHVSGNKAISEFDADVLILDDGFQVWKLYRDFDIVLLSADNLFDNRHTLPAGKLREPISSLYRAGCIIITGCKDANSRNQSASQIKEAGICIPIFFAEYVPTALILPGDGSKCTIEELKGKNVFAVSSIGNPLSFEKTLESIGTQIVGTLRYPDHHVYTQDDITDIRMKAITVSADMIITTMKDAVKLKRFAFDKPVFALEIEIALSNEDEFLELMSNAIKKSKDNNAD